MKLKKSNLLYASLILLILHSSFSFASSNRAYLLSGTVWDSPTINVCWESTANSNAQHRQWVRNAVARTWSSHSQLHFVGWGQCQTNSTGIRILVDDDGPHVKSLGNRLDGMQDGMVLNFTFNNWSQSCKNSLKFCIEVIAVHEFGHAIGLAHEHNRPDTPDFCTDDPQGTNGDTIIGEWDLQSVMNYCNPQWNGNGNLSATDVSAVVQIYGHNNLVHSEHDNFPVFSADYYLKMYPDLQAAYGADNYQGARWHWEHHGKYEGRHSSPSFHVKEYHALNYDLQVHYGHDYAGLVHHFTHHGVYEGRASSYTFNVHDYLNLNSDLKNHFGGNFHGAFDHWTRHGLAEGRRSSLTFSVNDYLAFNGDLRESFGSDRVVALLHFHQTGIHEYRRTSHVFHAGEYLNAYGDLQHAFGAHNYGAAFAHFIVHGLHEGRRSSNQFHTVNYLNRYPDLRNAFGHNNWYSAAHHWMMHGVYEGRNGS